MRLLVSIGSDDEGYVSFDAAMQVTHRRDNEVTQFPVEKGVTMTDHVRPMPVILEIVGIVSSTPIPSTPGAGVIDPFRVTNARSTILRWRDNATLLNVFTSKELYQQFVIKSVTEPSDATNGNDFEAEIVCQQVSTAELQFVQLPKPKKPSGAGTQNIGTAQAPTTPTSAGFAALFGTP